ncbi:MAG: tRNA1(Val) (adenine(37)-N6)-methyltransferase [Deltaproteobacteria bacterium]|nr:tRNA1(Val) (adenine(37)-N6)-methyltransferase [Deltaproteobacteria bacterium]
MNTDSAVSLLPDETLDAMFEGKLRVIQKKSGYRFSLDAVLLARLAPICPRDRVIDLGTGCGIIPLIIAHTSEAAEIIGVEIQEELADMARRNVAINGPTERITIFHEDLQNLSAHFPLGSFDCVVTNPPFRKLDTGRVNPRNQRAIARHEVMISLGRFLRVAFSLLRPSGKIFLIYSAARLVDLLCEMRGCKLEPKTIQFVHAQREDIGKMVLVEGMREGGVEAKIKEPLIIYDSEGKYTEAIKLIYSFPR